MEFSCGLEEKPLLPMTAKLQDLLLHGRKQDITKQTTHPFFSLKDGGRRKQNGKDALGKPSTEMMCVPSTTHLTPPPPHPAQRTEENAELGMGRAALVLVLPLGLGGTASQAVLHHPERIRVTRQYSRSGEDCGCPMWLCGIYIGSCSC